LVCNRLIAVDLWCNWIINTLFGMVNA
jgi:hypothetical protein